MLASEAPLWRRELSERLVELVERRKFNGPRVTAAQEVNGAIVGGIVAHMEFKIEKTLEGWELTLDGKIFVYERLSKVLARVEKASEALDGAPVEEKP